MSRSKIDALTEAERKVLGGLLCGGESYLPQLSLKPSDFSTMFGEIMYGLILSVHQSGKHVDQLSVGEAAGYLDEAGRRMVTAADVWGFYGSERASVTYYADYVSEDSSRRKLASHAARVNQLVEEGRPLSMILEEAESTIEGITASTGATIRQVGESIDETLDELDQPVDFTPTPWHNVNHFIQGWRPGGLYIVAARPGVGKTVAGLQAALSLCDTGPVAFTSIEMSSKQLELRMVSLEARVDNSRITRRQLTEEDWQSIVRARDRWKDLPLFIDPSRDTSVSQVARHAHSVKRKHGLSAVVVDYLQLLESTDRRKSEYEAITENSRQLRLLARQLQVPVIVLAQLNRGSESRDGKRPQSSDIRGSGAVEQDADVVLLLHRDLVETPWQAELIVAKNRHGFGGTAHMDFVGHHSMLRDSTRTSA